jgi:tRNA-dihydrouridine synthase A
MAPSPKTLDRRISVAPMMDWTDRHCRYFHRLLSPNALLYTEMIHANAITRGDADKHLFFHAAEKPVALQLGGIDAQALAAAAKHGEDTGYAEINLNCGCPSDRVQAGEFGACLMDTPERVADAVAAMRAAVNIPVTVKTRLGIDDRDDYAFLHRFVETVHKNGGCDVFILHARKAWLSGLSPKENRSIPPLDWARVHKIKAEFPHLTIITNGGFEHVADIAAQFDTTRSSSEAIAQYKAVDGVMIGRKAYHDPYFLTELEAKIFKNPHAPSRAHIVSRMLDYIATESARGTFVRHTTKHMHGLFHAQPHSKAWKHALNKAARDNDPAPLVEFSKL